MRSKFFPLWFLAFAGFLGGCTTENGVYGLHEGLSGGVGQVGAYEGVGIGVRVPPPPPPVGYPAGPAYGAPAYAAPAYGAPVPGAAAVQPPHFAGKETPPNLATGAAPSPKDPLGEKARAALTAWTHQALKDDPSVPTYVTDTVPEVKSGCVRVQVEHINGVTYTRNKCLSGKFGPPN